MTKKASSRLADGRLVTNDRDRNATAIRHQAMGRKNCGTKIRRNVQNPEGRDQKCEGEIHDHRSLTINTPKIMSEIKSKSKPSPAEPSKDGEGFDAPTVRAFTFSTWVNPDRLIMDPDGTLRMKDGSDVKEYFRQWMTKMGQKKPEPVTFMTFDHAESINFPWAS